MSYKLPLSPISTEAGAQQLLSILPVLTGGSEVLRDNPSPGAEALFLHPHRSLFGLLRHLLKKLIRGKWLLTRGS